MGKRLIKKYGYNVMEHPQLYLLEFKVELTFKSFDVPGVSIMTYAEIPWHKFLYKEFIWR